MTMSEPIRLTTEQERRLDASYDKHDRIEQLRQAEDDADAVPERACQSCTTRAAGAIDIYCQECRDAHDDLADAAERDRRIDEPYATGVDEVSYADESEYMA